jgi:flagellar assembly protein FliH
VKGLSSVEDRLAGAVAQAPPTPPTTTTTTTSATPTGLADAGLANTGLTLATADFPFEQLEPSAPPPRDTHQQILARAAGEGERLLDRARAQGYAEGHEKGLQDGLAETAAAAQALGEALQGVRELREQIAQEVEHDAVELALALSAKVLAGALELEPQRVLDVVRGVLRRVTDRRHITLLVDPADVEIVSGALSDLQTQLGGIELCDVQADRRVGRGGAVVRTVEGEIDLTIETQLQRARELMLGEPCDEQS